MRLKHFLYAFLMLFVIGIIIQCENYDFMKGPSPDSDRPEWAGGNTDANPHINQNDNSGTTQGGDYGDLYVLKRDQNGVPIMTEVDVDGDGVIGEEEYFVQPIDAFGNEIELDQYGEIPEGAPVIEVDFGRLNIVRSPQSVLDQAFEEAMKVLAAPGAVISLDFCGRLTSTYPDPITSEIIVKTIDSPRENMAIYQYIMTHMFENTETMTNRLGFLGEAPYNFDPLTIAASCFAAGSDKTGTITIDEVVYVNGFLDCIGLNPILNEHEYDFNHDYKWYFNFGDCTDPVDCQHIQNKYQYNRDVYANRYLRIITLNGDGTYTEAIESVKDAMEFRGLFTNQWGGQDLTHVEGFACAADDAVQVLDFVHGDSNIEFLPGYTP